MSRHKRLILAVISVLLGGGAAYLVFLESGPVTGFLVGILFIRYLIGDDRRA